MRVKLYGIESLCFPDKETGILIRMKKLHVLGLAVENDTSDRGVIGQRCGSVITKLNCSKLVVGKDYDLRYELPLGSSKEAKARLMDIVPIS